MAQLREEGALSEKRVNFFRAVCTIELSVDVLWKFLETAVPDKDKDKRFSKKWWLDKLLEVDTFQRREIEKKPPREWDISVLAYAILHHPNLVKGKQKVAVEKMRDKRNALYHKHTAIYEKKEFDQLFVDLALLYKCLLGESEARRDFCKKLTDIQKMPIYDKRIEKVLVKRDEALRNAEEREEETMRIHTELLEDMIRRVEQMKDKTDELKDHTARAHEDTAHTHDLATGLDVDVDWIINRLKIAVESSEEKAEEREEATMQIHTTLLGDIITSLKQMKTDELKDHTAHAHEDTAHTQDLATDLDVDVDWIIDILSHSSLTTTVPKGSDGAGVQAGGPDPVPQESDKHPVSILKEYCDKNKFVQPEYNFEPEEGLRWKCTVTIKTMTSSGETEEELFEGKIESNKRDTKRAAAEKAIEKLGIS